LHRLTALHGMSELSQVLLPDAIKRVFVPALQQMSKDKVPNIRMNVAKTIHVIRTRKTDGASPVDGQIEQDLLSILNDLKSDEDDDVKYYTKKAIAK